MKYFSVFCLKKIYYIYYHDNKQKNILLHYCRRTTNLHASNNVSRNLYNIIYIF